jgi:hypothetical protein
MKRSLLLGATIILASFFAGQASAASLDYYHYYTGYVSSVGDPSGLTSSNPADAIVTGGVEVDAGYIPYVNGVRDPSGLTSRWNADETQTGSIGSAEPRVDVEAFCEGEGKLLAERHYVGFCHLAD